MGSEIEAELPVADVTLGSTVIQASHVLQLRTALDAARLALGLSTRTYIDR